jgi:hypothetical protein
MVYWLKISTKIAALSRWPDYRFLAKSHQAPLGSDLHALFFGKHWHPNLTKH